MEKWVAGDSVVPKEVAAWQGQRQLCGGSYGGKREAWPCGDNGGARASGEEGGEHNDDDGTGNSTEQTRQSKGDENGDAMVRAGDREDERRRGISTAERQKGGRGSEEEDKGHRVMHTER